MKYMIGVDGGGTKTEAIAFNQNGKEVAKGMSRFGNVLLEYEKALSHIITAINQCQQGLPQENCVCIILGLAGVKSIDIEGLKKRLIEKYQTHIEIYDDAMIAHAALLKGKDGILTIAGTGAICLGKKGETYEYSGGWGHILGDAGSGYWIAMQALKRMTMEYDKGIPFCSLSQAVQEQFHIHTPSDIKQLVYSSAKDKVAAIVPLVIEEARKGNNDASKIILQAGKELARITVDVYKKMSFEVPISIAVKGGILCSVPEIYAEFKRCCREHINKINFIKSEISSAKGAYFLAAKRLSLF
ncbi:BadF/BadG/BcrA/BcrD ATPase family protein [Bacillus gaemokensis]|uniref:ATPase n=1 Tax=Bacillus gaemokensis TaxID=574375 RepID=A0A073KMG2_9BACI|nr:BadF/BadG/BcrA/BcrD ATPase family protein [Bacillus gaemokensis]KEK23538.1 ATPase [Bacillus gaemokensis]KYG27092.1 ATPase [Bacillus gaemokensis]